MSVADRWNPSTWGKPGKVVFCTRPGGSIDPTTLQALKKGGVEPIISSIRGADGKVPDEVANADMIVLQGPGGNGDAFEATPRRTCGCAFLLPSLCCSAAGCSGRRFAIKTAFSSPQTPVSRSRRS